MNIHAAPATTMKPPRAETRRPQPNPNRMPRRIAQYGQASLAQANCTTLLSIEGLPPVPSQRLIQLDKN